MGFDREAAFASLRVAPHNQQERLSLQRLQERYNRYLALSAQIVDAAQHNQLARATEMGSGLEFRNVVSTQFDAVEELEGIKAGYARNRAILQEALPAIGLKPLPMDGAFYAYCDIGRFSNDSMAFSKKALHEAGLAITPGLDFDLHEGNRFVRLSYAGSEADILEGVKRLKAWLG